MEKQEGLELTNELQSLLSKIPQEEMALFRELINQSDLNEIQNVALVSEVLCNGKSE